MKRWPLGFLLVLAVSAYAAESFWDGNAAVQRGDAAFEAGMVALSSAFARDTEIVVEDLATGTTTSARVIGRVDDRLDILVLLSPAAARPLGLEPGAIAHVRVRVKRVAATSEPILAEKTAPSPDLDRVPPPVQRAATILEPVAAAPAETEPAEPAASEAQPLVAASGEEPASEAAPPAQAEPSPTESAAAPEEPAEPAAATALSAEEAALLAELAARSPQKRLFLPPREDEMFAYQKPVEPPPAASPPIEVVQQPAETAPTAAAPAASGAPPIASEAGPAAPEHGAEPIALAEAEPPREIRPEIVESLTAKPPKAEERPTQLLAEPPTEPRAVPAPAARPPAVSEAPAAAVAAAPAAKPADTVPPVTKPAPEAAATPAANAEAVRTVLDLPGQGTFTWYLQLAAYANESLARDTAARLSSTYPVLVLVPQSGQRALYRVFVGPLNRAESGTLLRYFRDRGFPDAFVRTARN